MIRAEVSSARMRMSNATGSSRRTLSQTPSLCHAAVQPRVAPAFRRMSPPNTGSQVLLPVYRMAIRRDHRGDAFKPKCKREQNDCY
jgi:hypothetical protein